MDQRPDSPPGKYLAASLGVGALACLTYLSVTVLVWLGMVALWDALDQPDNYYLFLASPFIAAGIAALLVVPAAVLLRKRRWLGRSVALGGLAGSLVVPLLCLLAAGALWLFVRAMCAGNPTMMGC